MQLDEPLSDAVLAVIGSAEAAVRGADVLVTAAAKTIPRQLSSDEITVFKSLGPPKALLSCLQSYLEDSCRST